MSRRARSAPAAGADGRPGLASTAAGSTEIAGERGGAARSRRAAPASGPTRTRPTSPDEVGLERRDLDDEGMLRRPGDRGAAADLRPRATAARRLSVPRRARRGRDGAQARRPGEASGKIDWGRVTSRAQSRRGSARSVSASPFATSPAGGRLGRGRRVPRWPPSSRAALRLTPERDGRPQRLLRSTPLCWAHRSASPSFPFFGKLALVTIPPLAPRGAARGRVGGSCSRSSGARNAPRAPAPATAGRLPLRAARRLLQPDPLHPRPLADDRDQHDDPDGDDPGLHARRRRAPGARAAHGARRGSVWSWRLPARSCSSTSSASTGRAGFVRGDLLLLGNCLSYSLLSGAVAARSWPATARRPSTTAVFLYGRAASSSSPLPRSRVSRRGPSRPGAWGSLGGIVVFCTVLPYLWNSWALARTRASRVAFYVFLQPLIAPSLAVVILGERSTPQTVVGGRSSILAGLAVLADLAAVPAAVTPPDGRRRDPRLQRARVACPWSSAPSRATRRRDRRRRQRVDRRHGRGRAAAFPSASCASRGGATAARAWPASRRSRPIRRTSSSFSTATISDHPEEMPRLLDARSPGRRSRHRSRTLGMPRARRAPPQARLGNRLACFLIRLAVRASVHGPGPLPRDPLERAIAARDAGHELRLDLRDAGQGGPAAGCGSPRCPCPTAGAWASRRSRAPSSGAVARRRKILWTIARYGLYPALAEPEASRFRHSIYRELMEDRETEISEQLGGPLRAHRAPRARAASPRSTGCRIRGSSGPRP